MRLEQDLVGGISMEAIMKGNKKEEKMDERIKKLRFDFEAETDIALDKSPDDWQNYALWLEKLTIEKLNGQMIKENDVLKNMVNDVVARLQEGIVQRVD